MTRPLCLIIHRNHSAPAIIMSSTALLPLPDRNRPSSAVRRHPCAVALPILLFSAGMWAASAAAHDGLQDAAPAQPAALQCPNGVVAQVAHALHFKGDDAFWNQGPALGCVLDPAHPRQAIVALTYLHGEERTGTRQEALAGTPRDLDLAVWDLDQRRMLAHRHEDQAIQDDAAQLESLSMETGAYAWAAGKSIFGLRTITATHCTCDNTSYEAVTLYVQNGERIDSILAFTPHAWEGPIDDEGSAPDPACKAIMESSTRLTAAPAGSHGFADLVSTITRTPHYASDVPATCPPLKPEVKNATLRFDGKRYAPAGGH